LLALRTIVDRNPENAIKHSLLLAKKVKNLADLKLKSDILHVVGLSFDAIREFDKALDWYNQALELKRLCRDKIGEAKALNNIGLVYYQLSRFREAIPFLIESAELKLELKEYKSLTGTYANLGTAYEKLSEDKKAMGVYYKSLKISEKLNDDLRIAQTLMNMGIIYQKRNDNRQALEFYQRARKLQIRGDNKLIIIQLDINIAVGFARLKQYKEALHYYEHCLPMARSINYLPGVLASTINIGDSLKQLGRLDEALAASQNALQLAESEDIETDRCNALTNIGEIHFLARRYPQAIDYLNKALVVARRIKAKNSEAEICKLLSKLYESAKNPTKALQYYKQYDKAKAAISNTEIANRINQLQTQYEVAKKEEELLKSKALQVESELKALRAQMDPHFIFNSLSTMRKELLEGNIDKADQYIVRFSRLLGLILDTTRTPSVKLSDNIELLNLYIQIEQSRQAKSFSYRINIARGISTDNIYIPGMVLQPLVENAILHGLYQRQDGNGKLYVGFSKVGKVLKIKVSDNGVGRKHSAAIKVSGHKSHATSIIRETLALAWKDKMKDRYFSIKDKTSKQGEPEGTEVTVLLPLAYY